MKTELHKPIHPRFSKCLALLLSAGATLVGSAHGQGDTSLWDAFDEPCSLTQLDLVDSSWVLSPVITNGSLVSIFGQMETAYSATSVSLVFSLPNSQGDWLLLGWAEDNPVGAANFVRSVYGDKSLLPHIPTIQTDSSLPALESPEFMPHGLLISDPYAATIAANPNPNLLSHLIDMGAAGAPYLSRALLDKPTNPNANSGMNLLNEIMGYGTLGMSESMAVPMSPSVDQSFQFAFTDQSLVVATLQGAVPICWRNFGPWNPWTCTGGPIPMTTVGGFKCRFTGCTRTRLVITTYPFGIQTEEDETQGPQNVDIVVAPPGGCAGVTPND